LEATRFLRKPNQTRTNIHSAQQTALALAHTIPTALITLLESAPALTEIGAGIQLPPPSTAALFSWGLKPALLAASIIPRAMLIRSGAAGDVLGEVEMAKLESEYGAPYIVVHRAVLHAIMVTRCREVGVRIRTGFRVARVGFEEGWVEVEGGERVEGGLVVAADGINGAVREWILDGGGGEEEDVKARQTGWAAYRLMAPVERLKADPDLVGLLEGNCSQLWLGDGASCMSYLVKDATFANLVLSHRDDVDTSKFSQEEFAGVVKELMAPFEPRVAKLMEIACEGKIANWPVYAVPRLPTWSRGKTVLVGDAAHAMAFWLSMGVGMAVEDGLALAEALRLIFSQEGAAVNGDATNTEADRLRKAIRIFEQARKPRAEAVAAASLHAGTVLHLADGDAQRLRDEGLAYTHEEWKSPSLELGGVNGSRHGLDPQKLAYGIANKRLRDWCYGFDIVGSIREQWRGSRSSEQL
jgi:salicylate hydroxylase